ncbi:ABC transporter substrate-binding protein [Acrocarpospora catenulata]|uniref:ABC transporter substrate-binding protein n=1 Tax=Acrocarpospora catenulata TaxID=2836182 RepID=UPI001BDB4AF1|nr:ABC transporter substrate-binding protein [Acrocarpospora catenulata]
MPKDSPAKSFADLKGKKIIFLKTTNTYTQFLKQVAEAGLKESDFTIVQIAGPDANKAFETDQVDAYYTIDPNMADVQNRSGARLLLDGEGYQNNYYVYTATKKAVAEKAAAIGAVIGEVAKTIPWIHANPDEQARLLSPKLGFSEAAIKTGYARGSTKLIPQDAEFLKQEQSQVPTFVKAGLLPREVDLTPLFIPDFNAFINPT